MSIQLQPYWLPRPPFILDDPLRATFRNILERAVDHELTSFIDFPADLPKWQFLCYISEELDFALHGSLDPDIPLFEPRQPQDLREFGAQRAVYAAADGIWPMYLAIVDRVRYPTALINGCIRVEAPDGTISGPYYHFSVGRHIIKQQPWRDGIIYLLPRDTFVAEPPIPFEEYRIYTAQLASLVPVKPIAKLRIAPEDFPFLSQVRSHDDARIAIYGAAIQAGLPWPDDENE